LLDPSRLDYIINNAFLDTGLRGEQLSIAVYNTTSVPSVGERAARVMSHLGLQLVFVGNSTPERPTCVVTGSSRALSTKTAMFIRDYFQCTEGPPLSTDAGAAADLVLYLGTQYAQQFVSGK